MIPTRFNPTGKDAKTINYEFYDFQYQKNGIWTPGDPEADCTLLDYPCRWHSSDTSASNWSITIIVLRPPSGTIPMNMIVSYSDGWLIQQYATSYGDLFVTANIYHKGKPIF